MCNGGAFAAYLYLYRVRAMSPEGAPSICRVFEHTLRLFQEPGWLGGSGMSNRSDPRDVLIYEIWGNLPSLQAWLTSEARRQAHRAIAPLVAGPAREETFQDI